MDLRDVKHFLEDFNFAKSWEEHRSAMLAAGVVVVLIPVFLLSRCGAGGSQQRVSSGRYFFDLNTGQLVVGASSDVGPVDLGGGTFAYPDGEFGSAVRARVISCNDCVGVEEGMTPDALRAVDATVAYLERLPPQGLALERKKHAGESLTSEEYTVLDTIEILYSNIKGTTWLPAFSPSARRLVYEARGDCGQKRARMCRP